MAQVIKLLPVREIVMDVCFCFLALKSDPISEFYFSSSFFFFFCLFMLGKFYFQKKVVLKVMTMADDKTKQKAIEAAADIYGALSFSYRPKILFIFKFPLKVSFFSKYKTEQFYSLMLCFFPFSFVYSLKSLSLSLSWTGYAFDPQGLIQLRLISRIRS